LQNAEYIRSRGSTSMLIEANTSGSIPVYISQP
jgi:hypothetical protein